MSEELKNKYENTKKIDKNIFLNLIYQSKI